MSIHDNTPGGAVMRWLYGLAAGLAIFSGMGQLPIMKRYYLADLPLMGWSANFYINSNLHYLAATLLLFVLFWRIALGKSLKVPAWTWGPRSWWGWTLLGLLIVSGAVKALRNYGVYFDPALLVVCGLTHLGSAMAFMFTGLVSLIRGRPEAGGALSA